jgi:hypothetical protein
MANEPYPVPSDFQRMHWEIWELERTYPEWYAAVYGKKEVMD